MQKKGKKRAYLELPISLTNQNARFWNAWPVRRGAESIKVSQDVPEESKFSLKEEENTQPLSKPSKIKDIDAYVETRQIVAKTSTVPSFKWPVEENYPIRDKTTTVTRDVNGNSAPLSHSPERPLLPGTATANIGYLHSPPRADQQQQQQKQMISPRLPKLSRRERWYNICPFHKSKKTTMTTTVTATINWGFSPNGSGKNVGKPTPKTPGTGIKHIFRRRTCFSASATQKRENKSSQK